jgi:exopolyphosphatase/guanosine-5'-triphosphate,3'-diphosphate pyrophosphatase
MFCSSDPISESEFAEMSEHAANALQQLPKELLQPGPTAGLIATGGTATTLAAIDANRIHPPRAGARHTVETPRVEVDHYELANLAELLDWLRKLPLAERRKIPGLPPARADIIVAGATILLEAMRCFGANTVAISARGARYGALMLNQ